MDKRRREDVMVQIDRVLDLLDGTCEIVKVAGSVRRGVEMVKDVELVAIQKPGDKLLARMDRLVIDGGIARADYGGSERWGERYRGFVFAGTRFEMFLTDVDSWGYQYWLRTGPGEANTYVMYQMAKFHSPYKCRDGAVWYGERRVAVRDEMTFFRLLGFPVYVPAHQRDIDVYRGYLRRPKWANPDDLVLLDDTAPKQRGLL